MTKEEILDKYSLKHYGFVPSDVSGKRWEQFVLDAMEEYAQQAIAEHKAKQWKKYPENNPEMGVKYYVHHKDGEETTCYYFADWALFHPTRIVIAFRELPESYKPE